MTILDKVRKRRGTESHGEKGMIDGPTRGALKCNVLCPKGRTFTWQMPVSVEHGRIFLKTVMINFLNDRVIKNVNKDKIILIV